MKIIFSDHAKQRNTDRKIPVKYILETVKNPEAVIKSLRNRTLRQKQFDGKILEVVTKIEDNIVIIITQYWLEKEGN